VNAENEHSDWEAFLCQEGQKLMKLFLKVPPAFTLSRQGTAS
jgi:hypothetical protein